MGKNTPPHPAIEKREKIEIQRAKKQEKFFVIF
jgi:hypothetical protein